MPLISVITPVYNKEKYVANAIESVLSQGFEDFEYIIIDDESTDNSPEILDEYAKKDPRIKVIHQKNQWIYASFNNGIRTAEGEYIYILNADDKLREGTLKKMACIARNYHPDVIWTKALSHKADLEQNILEYDHERLDERVQEDKYIKNSHELEQEWLFLNESLLTLNQANLYKRELMLKHPFRNDVYGADTLFNISIATDIRSAYIMKEPVYDFFEYINFSNASTGKYYGYEHEMFNDMYFDHIKLLKYWNSKDENLKRYVCRKRLRQFTTELAALKYSNCMLSIDEKLEKITSELQDGVVYECAKYLDAIEEFESRCLSGMRALLISEIPSENSNNYFWYELLDNLLRYEKTYQECMIIKAAIENSKNKFHIGQAFYKKLKRWDYYITQD